MFEEYGAGSSTVNTIQSQMAKMVLLAVEEYKKITQLRSDLWTEIHRGSDSLNNWLRELPASLHLSALGETDTDLTPQQVTAIYLMHTLFIDTHLLLYFRFIDFSYRSDANADGLAIERIFLDMPHSIFSTYTEFSIQLARIIALLYDQEKVFARCWMVIHATFDAMSMMLLSVCQTYYTSYESDIPQMMNLLDSCFRVLRFCSESDFVASRFVDMLTPTFFDVQSFDRLHEPDRMSISYVLNIEQVDQAAIRHTLCQLLEIISIERHKAWI
ncbi:hypothetical protein N7456_011055 [Penicillium angulare]|uniref:Uncharacterized protein n=1 Tax=Penicillium angulare TaxID=116970 RepID=A0A9W9ET81_9EURO|nr:hypothetical protein N7456_011055 [Penicillium angulare]